MVEAATAMARSAKVNCPSTNSPPGLQCDAQLLKCSFSLQPKAVLLMLKTVGIWDVVPCPIARHCGVASSTLPGHVLECGR